MPYPQLSFHVFQTRYSGTRGSEAALLWRPPRFHQPCGDTGELMEIVLPNALEEGEESENPQDTPNSQAVQSE